MKRLIFRNRDLDVGLQHRRFPLERNLQRDVRQGKRLPLRAIAHVQHRSGYYPRQREKFPPPALIIAHRLLSRFADRFRIQPRQFSVRAQNFAIQERDVLERRRVGDIKVAKSFPFGGQDLSELVLLAGQRRTAAERVTDAAPQNRRICLRILLRVNFHDFPPGSGQVARGGGCFAGPFCGRFLWFVCRWCCGFGGMLTRLDGCQRARLCCRCQHARLFIPHPKRRLLRQRQVAVLVPRSNRAAELLPQDPERTCLESFRACWRDRGACSR